MPNRGLVRWLQRLHLIVGSRAHRRHHCAPYDSHFAVINGWSNTPLDRLRAPRLIDWLLARLGRHKRGLQQSLVSLTAQLEQQPGALSGQSRG
jgi:hypothetical protein